MLHKDENFLEKLSKKEFELYTLLAQGMNTSEISKYLSMSYHDVAKINLAIKQKLNISSVKEIKKTANHKND